MSLRSQPNPSSRGLKSERAFTLVEVMIGMLVMVIIMMGLLASLITCYRLVLQARYQDRAMNVLVSLADQFQNSPRADTNTNLIRQIFWDATDTGEGLAWDADKQVFLYPKADMPVKGATDVLAGQYQGGASGLWVPLNSLISAGNPTPELAIRAKISRTVKTVDVAGGTGRSTYTGTTTATSFASNILVEATFTAEYFPPGTNTFIDSNKKRISVKVLRNLCRSDV